MSLVLFAVTAALVAAHLAAMHAVTGSLDATVVAVDLAVAAVVLLLGLWCIGRIVAERERQLAQRLLLPVLAEPRRVTDTARRAIETLEREQVAAAGLIAVADEESTAMQPLAAFGYPEGWATEAPSLDLPAARAATRLERQQRDHHPWLPPVRGDAGERPWVASVPLTSGNDAIGMLFLVARRPGPLRHREVLAALGQQLSAALDHAAMSEAAYRREQELEDQDQRRREFMAAISHEVRTPLTSIRAFTELLQMGTGPGDAQAQQLITSLSHGVDRLTVLVNDLIDLGRSGGFEYEVRLEPVDVRQLLDDASEVLRPAFILQDQALHWTRPARPLAALIDPRLMEQVVLNLLSNANRHAPPGGRVTLRARHADHGRVRIEVHDSGPGIDPADRERIFEPYYRVHRDGAGPVPGSGLGLAVARRMVNSLDGDLWVETSDSGGACFCLEVRAATTVDAPARGSWSERPAAGTAAAAPLEWPGAKRRTPGDPAASDAPAPPEPGPRRRTPGRNNEEQPPSTGTDSSRPRL